MFGKLRSKRGTRKFVKAQLPKKSRRLALKRAAKERSKIVKTNILMAYKKHPYSEKGATKTYQKTRKALLKAAKKPKNRKKKKSVWDEPIGSGYYTIYVNIDG